MHRLCKLPGELWNSKCTGYLNYLTSFSEQYISHSSVIKIVGNKQTANFNKLFSSGPNLDVISKRRNYRVFHFVIQCLDIRYSKIEWSKYWSLKPNILVSNWKVILDFEVKMSWNSTKRKLNWNTLHSWIHFWIMAPPIKCELNH